MLLVRTYSSTMTRFKNAQITVQASAPAADAREVTVRSMSSCRPTLATSAAPRWTTR